SLMDRLDAHGITYSVTSREMPFTGERFRIATNVMSETVFQGTHKARTLTGAWEAAEQALPAGSLVIPMNQPLARLTFILMDPRSDDGLMYWNIMDPVLGTTPSPQFYPVLRSMSAVTP
ncbi:MAG TPA: hypothetical protein VE869_15245, partial [Gemmatimonas sp.]|nr:hypothetical protein [Gemmatimonas sp.]